MFVRVKVIDHAHRLRLEAISRDSDNSDKLARVYFNKIKTQKGFNI